ncbi:MAG TPA: glycosyltransferase family 1 protein [Solirubrobacteraceae bacterium]|nr:glycosyltransferase family 1 protein [Solirubrobacteraceae bacterium]
MRVGVDGRSLVGGGARGVAHYTAALLEALASAFPDDEYRVLLPRGVATVPAGTVPVRHALPARVLFGAAALARRPRLDTLLGGCDVVWAPAPAPLAVGATPFVLTVHDRSWEERPQDFTRYERLWHAAARPRGLARRAARVLCDTEVVRGSLIREWGLDPGRVRTVPLAPRPMAGSGSPSAHPYFLSVGALEPRKAPDVLVAGFRLARERGLAAELVVAGDGRVNVEAPGVRRLGHVEDLGSLYAGALAVVLPSWIEGFGLTPVEGLAAGTPAIVSDLPVLREVLGDGALYVRPGDAAGLADALLSVAGDAALRERLVAAGRAAIAPLSWAETARRTRAVLAEAAGA